VRDQLAARAEGRVKAERSGLERQAFGIRVVGAETAWIRTRFHQIVSKKRERMSHHILFVDDEPPVRETLSLFFKMKGIAVTAVATGAEALEHAKKTAFSLAILDVKLGGEDGLELLQRFKQNYPTIPAVMFTAFGDDPDKRQKAFKSGASAYMCKGDSLMALFDTVMRVLRGEPATAG
jgi:CheY-like chemotaxis protein